MADKVSENILLPQVPLVPDITGLAGFGRDQNRQLIDYLENLARKSNLGDLTDGGVIVGDIDITGDLLVIGDGSFTNLTVTDNFTGTGGTFAWTGNGSFSGTLGVADDAYAAGWNGSTNVPTKNALWDKIETLQPLDTDLTTLAGLTRTRGDLIVGGASAWIDLALGTTGYFLKSDGTDVVWVNQPTLLSLEGLTLNAGDMLYATAADTLADLAIGTALQDLRTNAAGTAPEWYSRWFVNGASGSITGASTFEIAIPSGSREVIIELSGLSWSGTVAWQAIRLGDAGGAENSGYVAMVATVADSGNLVASSTTEAPFFVGMGAGDALSGFIRLEKVSSTVERWAISGGMFRSDGTRHGTFTGLKTLSAAITTVTILNDGADTLDVGTYAVYAR